MIKYFENLAKALLGQTYSELDKTEQKIINSIAEQTSVSENVNQSFHEKLTLGQRAADKIAYFGGSWTFILIFILCILIWIALNSFWLISKTAFDPYPFILLNLALSTLAAFQAPIIMMSQNRQIAKDRLEQKAAYEINLKMELEIMRLHNRLDELITSNQKLSDSDQSSPTAS